MRILVYTLAALVSISIVVGILFKLLHLPGGNALLLLGMSALAFVFIPLVTIYLYRKRRQN